MQQWVLFRHPGTCNLHFMSRWEYLCSRRNVKGPMFLQHRLVRRAGILLSLPRVQRLLRSARTLDVLC